MTVIILFYTLKYVSYMSPLYGIHYLTHSGNLVSPSVRPSNFGTFVDIIIGCGNTA